MKTSDLISQLQTLYDKHGDLPVTLAVGPYEYSASVPDHCEEGPLPNVGEAQYQNPPERIVIEARDDIPDTKPRKRNA
jgi:hypothetical protein